MSFVTDEMPEWVRDVLTGDAKYEPRSEIEQALFWLASDRERLQAQSNAYARACAKAVEMSNAFERERDRLQAALTAAEGDSKRIDWLESHAGLVAGDLTPETRCGDAAFGWIKVPLFSDPPMALRGGIDKAAIPDGEVVA